MALIVKHAILARSENLPDDFNFSNILTAELLPTPHFLYPDGPITYRLSLWYYIDDGEGKGGDLPGNPGQE